MKKVIYLLAFLITISIVSGYRLTEKNVSAEKKANSSALKNSGVNNKLEAEGTNPNIESDKAKTETESRPKILLMLKNETGLKKWSPSLWWSYQYANPSQSGC